MTGRKRAVLFDQGKATVGVDHFGREAEEGAEVAAPLREKEKEYKSARVPPKTGAIATHVALNSVYDKEA